MEIDKNTVLIVMLLVLIIALLGWVMPFSSTGINATYIVMKNASVNCTMKFVNGVLTAGTC